MTKVNRWRAVSFVLALGAVVTVSARAQTFTSLVSFDGADGAEPYTMSLVQGPDGNLYGTTLQGGTGTEGTAFRITPGGALTKLYNFFSDGEQPYAGLVLGTDGNFYGTTKVGGPWPAYGTIFKISPSGNFATVYDFGSVDGAYPLAQLIQGTDGNFYGTSSSGGNLSCSAPAGCGTVFRITPSGVLTTLYSFSGTDGATPAAGLVQASDGNFYGITEAGGAKNEGTVFKVTAGGALTTLYSFCSDDCLDGAVPLGTLIQATDGNLYGTTSRGGAGGGNGTVFRIDLHGKLTTLYSFRCSDTGCVNGAQPYAGLVQATDGNLYGTTPYYGTVFKIDRVLGTVTTVYRFCSQPGCADGLYPYGGLLQATNGTLYGTTYSGGVSGTCSGGCGTVFSLSMGLGPFVTFVRGAGRVGQPFGILGQGFAGATAVSLNGIATNFRVVSETLIKATVPSGATTGYVTVTTPTGVLTSNVPFQVIP